MGFLPGTITFVSEDVCLVGGERQTGGYPPEAAGDIDRGFGAWAEIRDVQVRIPVVGRIIRRLHLGTAPNASRPFQNWEVAKGLGAACCAPTKSQRKRARFD